LLLYFLGIKKLKSAQKIKSEADRNKSRNQIKANKIQKKKKLNENKKTLGKLSQCPAGSVAFG